MIVGPGFFLSYVKTNGLPPTRWLSPRFAIEVAQTVSFGPFTRDSGSVAQCPFFQLFLGEGSL